MGILGEIIGVRQGLRLRRKWWHHATVAAATVSTVVVFLMSYSYVARSNVVLTKDNTQSLSLLRYTRGRQGVTTLEDLDALVGYRALVTPRGGLVLAARPPAPETVRCENPAHYKAGVSFTVDGVQFRPIADHRGQPASEPRFCAATQAYAQIAADGVLVLLPDTLLVRKQQTKGLVGGLVAAVLWLVGFWAVYYRTVVPVYLRRRKARQLRRQHEYAMR